MGQLVFNYPIGSKADLEELLYISAIHQSSPQIRKDATIISDDIKHYLISRHGIVVTDETVENVILHGFTNSKRLDLVELVTLLFVPQLVKIASFEEKMKIKRGEGVDITVEDSPIMKEQDSNMTSHHLIDFVLDMILFDTTGDKSPKGLTVDLIRTIFRKYGEDIDTDDDAILEEMLKVAKGKETGKDAPVILNKESFLRLITHDIRSYNTNEDRLSNIFGDVFGDGCKKYCSYPIHKNEDESGFHDTEIEKTFTKIKTAKGIDFVACTYQCRYHMVNLWVCFLLAFVGFIYPRSMQLQDVLIPTCPPFDTLKGWGGNNQSAFGCEVGSSILKWIIIVLLIMCTGTFFITLDSSVGSTIDDKQRWTHFTVTIVLLLFAISGPLVIYPYQLNTPWLFYVQIFTYVCTGVFMYTRVKRDIREFFPRSATTTNDDVLYKELSYESYAKRSALYKIKQMQENARNVIGHVDSDSVIKAYYGKALSNFTKMKDESVTCGGILWTWKKYMSREIFYFDGVWISARILTSFVGQMILSTIILGFGITITLYVHNNWLSPSELKVAVKDNLNYVLTSLADKEIVQNTVNNQMQSTLNYFLQLLETLENAGIFKFDCFALGNHLKETCVGKSNNATNVVCNLFTCHDQYDNLCVLLESVYRPLNDIAARSLEQESVPVFFDTTSVRAPFVNFVTEAVSDNVVSQVQRIYPQAKYMVLAPVAVAATIAVIVSHASSLSLIPSLVSTTLKLRSGIIPTFKSDDFSDLHFHTFNVTKLTGGMFWSNVLGSVIVGCTIGE